MPTEAERADISFKNSQIIKGVSLVICFGFLTLGLTLINVELLELVFPDIDLTKSGVLWRIHSVQIFFLVAGYVVLCLGWLVTKVPRFDALPERYVGVIVSLALTLFLLVSLEAIAATRHEPDYFPKDPNIEAKATGATFLRDDLLGHILNPGSKEYEINSAGFRGEEFPFQKEEDEIRIVAMGDSITFGFGLDETAPYPYQLQKMLQSEGNGHYSYRVINAGVPSYDSLQVLLTFEHRVLELEPDLIIVTVGWNDLSYSLRDWYPEISLYTGKKPTFTPALLKMARNLAPKPDVKSMLLNNTPDPRAVEAYRHNLENIIDLAERHQVKVILTNLPTILSIQGNTPEELEKAELFPKVENVLMFQQVIDEVCATHQSENVHCVNNLFSLEEANKCPYFGDYCHPYTEGHTIIAFRLLDALRRFQRVL
jgi:lysophospholipase L1-like esterase